MIIQNLLQAKKYLPAISIKEDITTMDDNFLTAEQELTNDILGEELLALLESKNEEDSKLLTMCERVISLSGFLAAIPELDLVLTQSGFAVHSSEKMSPASRQRVDALIQSVTSRLDKATDTLIDYLIATAKYDDVWRSTDQFDNITAGLISTYSEFKRYALYTPSCAENYPTSYNGFKKHYAGMKISLNTTVASRISQAYATELLEKYRDRVTINSFDMKVLEYVKHAISSEIVGDHETVDNMLNEAVSFMKKNPGQFLTFFSSEANADMTLTHEDTPIFSMF